MLEKIATPTSYATSAWSLLYGLLTFNQWMAIIGALCAVVTAIGNLYFRWRFARDRERATCEECPYNEIRKLNDAR